jgi:hypothetical protein
MQENGTIEVTITLSKRDVFRGGLLLFRESYKWHFRIALGISVLISLFFLAVFFGAPPERRSELYSALFVAIGLPTFVYCFPFLILGAVGRSLFRNNPRLKEPTRYIFSQEGIIAESPVGRAELNWSLYLRVREAGEYFLLYTSPKLANALPKRCFSSKEDIRRFREVLRLSISGRVEVQPE